MHQVPHRVVGVGRARVTSGQTQGGEVQLHADGDELVQRIRLVGGVGDHDARGQRIITGQSGDTERFVAEEERSDDVVSVGSEHHRQREWPDTRTAGQRSYCCLC